MGQPPRAGIYTNGEGRFFVGGVWLSQLGALRFGLLEDGYVGVGVFPNCEKVLIGGMGFGGVSLKGESTCQAQPGERTPGEVPHQSSVINELLKLRCGPSAVVQHEVGLPAQING